MLQQPVRYGMYAIIQWQFSFVLLAPWPISTRATNRITIHTYVTVKPYLPFPLVNLFWHHVLGQMRHEHSWRWKTRSFFKKLNSLFRWHILWDFSSGLSKIKLNRGRLEFSVNFILVPIMKNKIDNLCGPMCSYKLNSQKQNSMHDVSIIVWIQKKKSRSRIRL